MPKFNIFILDLTLVKANAAILVSILGGNFDGMTFIIHSIMGFLESIEVSVKASLSRKLKAAVLGETMGLMYGTEI